MNKIKQKFNSKNFDSFETYRREESGYWSVLGLFLTLSEARKFDKNFENFKKELLDKNPAIKDIKESYVQEYYYDEYEGYWIDEIPSDFSWWDLKKQNYVRKFKKYEFEINEGYELIHDAY